MFLAVRVIAAAPAAVCLDPVRSGIEVVDP
jgi:hypothetical protein